LRKIPQENLKVGDITDNTGICEKHFDSRFIIRNFSAQRPDGSVITCPRDAPSLDKDAIHTLFPNVPSYLSAVLPPQRKHPDQRRAEGETRDNVFLQEWLDEDIIVSFDDFKTKLPTKVKDLGVDS
jgi:hypothetical protein